MAQREESNWKKGGRFLVAIFFMVAGIFHWLRPAAYLSIMPPMLPWPLALIYVSGAAELAGGVGLLVPFFRRWAGWGLIALLAAVFPANIYMLTAKPPVLGMHPPDWVLWLRLPLQFGLMGLVDWVARSSREVTV